MRGVSDLLAVDVPRPHADPSVVSELRDYVVSRFSALRERFSASVWLSPSMLTSAGVCEGMYVAQTHRPPPPLTVSSAAALIAHKAIQTRMRFPRVEPARAVSESAVFLADSNPTLEEFWTHAPSPVRAEVLAAAENYVAAFGQFWPPLPSSYLPRFDVPLSIRAGSVTLSSRPSLILGQPRPPRQTMLICHLTLSPLDDTHRFVADLNATVATLHFEWLPFRSVVFSLADGTWTSPADVDRERLMTSAETLVHRVEACVELLADLRAPKLTPGPQCVLCPAVSYCQATAQACACGRASPVTISAVS